MQLFTPLDLGALTLPNRIVMAPMTRTRSGEDGVPGAIVAEYYAQRAGAGLIITEGVFTSSESRAYPGQPGIVTNAQQQGWADVAAAVHAEGGRVFMQLMHGGRVAHMKITDTDRIVAPSAIAINGEVRLADGSRTPFPTPHALTTDELAEVRAEFVETARRAVAAGLDGVEIHAANGYLLHEFLAPSSNQRTDGYGGSPDARAKFVIEVAEAVVAEIGADRVGIRISPSHNIQDIVETDPDDVKSTYLALVRGIRPLGLSYLSILHAEPAGDLVQSIRQEFAGAFVVNTGFGAITTREDAEAFIADGIADAVAVGRPLISNPDLADRWKSGAEETPVDPATLYGSSAVGYTDYPKLKP
ncbi:2,4-dienoyl-CoA reductase-like NADH-dependent reductase (Old Yellow Enzyme family) [Microbacterium halimionae]|uniref:2,4-dienoyl-CoA reductase-like NADH-dependent reductase (Old Yellow Enzyme family) n=1 Tax=Microbacterium halimionae TaxID=1526413 RepID=A0A7W3PK89_9MICO|nr:alkene reductase [Microbacterium halimionae]MBA8815265.1 2,4-dienoyl-CoA reductase-like NADH-dependent reductase (Old Yellow Enzyme family) [Microbacterium halimionae]NII93944.1 2,4-dienoyl-CoA reductase-like NADH-dependent reductase (Old Yellow Enzyme family) [Microbacterium halimionae]